MTNPYNQKMTREGKGKWPADQHDLREGSRKIIPGPSASRVGSSESTAIPISSNIYTDCSAPAKSASMVCVLVIPHFRARVNFDEV